VRYNHIDFCTAHTNNNINNNDNNNNKLVNESMVKAIDAVKSGLCSIKRAAEDYKVPKTTLQDRTL